MLDPASTAPLIATVVSRSEGRFYVAMAVVAMLIVTAGFGPGLFDPSIRRAPLTISVAAHGAVFTAWLVLFLTQTLLIPKGQFAIHRRLGYAGAILAVLMVVSGYFTAIAMTRRGYDLSGDLVATVDDALTILVFQLGDLVSFSILVAAAVLYRRRADIHKRLMLLATVGALMGAPLAHVIGHWPLLRDIKAPIILIPLVMLYFAGAVHDRLSRGRIHPVALWGAIGLFVGGNVRAAIIGPSDLWHQFAAWLIR
jgi:hypothetical protein